MSDRSSHRLEALSTVSWLAGVALAVIVFVVFRYLLPALVPQQSFPAGAFVHGFKQLAWLLAFAILLVTAPVAFRRLWARRLLDRQTGIHSILALSWQDFETLIVEAYRRQGYSVEPRGGSQPDGGIDLILHRDGKILVQCKHWKAQRVGVKEARELLGVVHAEKARGGILVTSGRYTPEARDFAAGQPLTLVDGRALVSLLATVQRERSIPAATPAAPAVAAPAPPICPRCGSPMVLRTARRGGAAGAQFWGCATYPRCQETRSV